MSVIQYPTNLPVGKQSWIQQRQDIEFRSMFGAQAMEASPPLWATTLTATDNFASLAGPWQSLMLQLRGKVNQLAMYNIGRPVPVGTMRGVMTLAATAQGATSLALSAAGQAAATLVSGDYLGFGSGLTQQVVMVVANATADGSGNITVTIEPPLRNAFVAGSAVTWNYPCALFRRKDTKTQWDYDSTMVSGMMLDLLEDVRP